MFRLSIISIIFCKKGNYLRGLYFRRVVIFGGIAAFGIFANTCNILSLLSEGEGERENNFREVLLNILVKSRIAYPLVGNMNYKEKRVSTNQFRYIKIHTGLRGLLIGGIKQKKSSWGSAMNNTFFMFYSPKPRSQVWILMYVETETSAERPLETGFVPPCMLPHLYLPTCHMGEISVLSWPEFVKRPSDFRIFPTRRPNVTGSVRRCSNDLCGIWMYWYWTERCLRKASQHGTFDWP